MKKYTFRGLENGKLLGTLELTMLLSYRTIRQAHWKRLRLWNSPANTVACGFRVGNSYTDQFTPKGWPCCSSGNIPLCIWNTASYFPFENRWGRGTICSFHTTVFSILEKAEWEKLSSASDWDSDISDGQKMSLQDELKEAPMRLLCPLLSGEHRLYYRVLWRMHPMAGMQAAPAGQQKPPR